ncbi:MAG: hypothetical protein WD379_02495 [Dehalococcoidia bacterium]
MTQDPESGPHSMRYSIDEVLSGMLASIERDTFTDESQRLGEVFKGLAHETPQAARRSNSKGPLPAGFLNFGRQTLDPVGRGPFRDVMVETEGN